MNEARRAVVAAIVFLCLSAAAPAFARPSPATGRAECLSLRSQILGRAVAYCVLLPPSYDAEKTQRYPVLYFLHGLGDNEQMFLRSGGLNLIEDLWEQGQLGEYLIVTPEGDASFYINSRDGRQRYEDFLIGECLPFIEHRYRTKPGRTNRGIGGISMGGYGALHLAFRHPELFGSVSAHSAALIETVPAFNIADPVFGSPPDRSFWERNSPFALARNGHLAGLKIYFDCGAEDDYGFNAGAQALHNLLASRKIAHEFHIYPGGHNWPYFVGHLPASLQFHSRAFGLGPEK